MLSDVLHSYGDSLSEELVKLAAYGTVSPSHAQNFAGLYKQSQRKFDLKKIISGDASWPRDPADSDLLYFLVQSFRGQLLKELPDGKAATAGDAKRLAHDSKAALATLAEIQLELAQMVVSSDEAGESLPDWYLMEVYRDLPRLVSSK